LEQTGLADTVELEVRDGELVVRPAAEPRAGWDEAFARMAANGDDVLLDGDSLPPTRWEVEEWRW
jgi:antitoxin MazE